MVQTESVDLGRAFSVGIDAFKRYPGLVIGVPALYFVLNMAGQSIPVLQVLYMIFIQPPIAGGLVIFALNVINDRNPTVGDLFAGFQEYGKWMGTYWLLTAISLACLIPALIAFGIGAALELEDASIVVIVLGSLVSLAALIMVMLRWMFVYYAAAEGMGAIDAFKRSAELTQGVRPQLLGASIVLGLFAACGVIALVVGVVVTWGIALCAFAAIYRNLKTAMEPAEAAAASFPAGPAPTSVTPGVEPTPTVIYASQPTPDATAPPSVQWYFAAGGRPVGPLTQADLMARIQAGEVTGETLVWQGGMANWTPAAQVPELAPLLSPPADGGPRTSA